VGEVAEGVEVGDPDAAGRVGGDADGLDHLLELGQAGRGRPEAAGAVAHGVAVLAEDERHGPPAGVEDGVGQRLLLAAADAVDLGVGRVHAAVDVDVRTGPVAFVVQRP
jgi:hypothetical protein